MKQKQAMAAAASGDATTTIYDGWYKVVGICIYGEGSFI